MKSLDEMKKVLDWSGTVDFQTMDVVDQLTFIAAIDKMCETIEPLYKKYTNKNDKKYDDLDEFLNLMLGNILNRDDEKEE